MVQLIIALQTLEPYCTLVSLLASTTGLIFITVGWMSKAFQNPSHPYFVPFCKKQTKETTLVSFPYFLCRARLDTKIRRPERSIEESCCCHTGLSQLANCAGEVQSSGSVFHKKNSPINGSLRCPTHFLYPCSSSASFKSVVICSFQVVAF